jgi:hypothetical protein
MLQIEKLYIENDNNWNYISFFDLSDRAKKRTSFVYFSVDSTPRHKYITGASFNINKTTQIISIWVLLKVKI